MRRLPTAVLPYLLVLMLIACGSVELIDQGQVVRTRVAATLSAHRETTAVLHQTTPLTPAVARSSTTIFVSSTADSGEGSLRAALLRVREGETIQFETAVFPHDNPTTIYVTSDPLPDVAVDGIIIDASNVGVVLDGSALTEGNGLRILAQHVVVRGLQIVNFPDNGIRIDQQASHVVIGGHNTALRMGCEGNCNLVSGNGQNGIEINASSHNTISGNYIGTDLQGDVAWGNGLDGIVINWGGQHNQIGGQTAETYNLISGNRRSGVALFDQGTMHNTVSGNDIGVNAVGDEPLPNGSMGINLGGGVQHNLIGGSAFAWRNVVSGNREGGIHVSGLGVSHNIVSGNFVGLDREGAHSVGNGRFGIAVTDQADHNQIGGTFLGEGNVISGNDDMGLFIADVAGTVVQGNLIGSDKTGRLAIANQGDGIWLGGGAQDNWIGGEAQTTGNLISGNRLNGLRIEGEGTTNNRILGNFIGVALTQTTAVSNQQHGLSIAEGAQNNRVGPNNVIAYNGAHGLEIGPDTSTQGQTITGNQIYENGGMGVSLLGGNGQIAAPILNMASSNQVDGQTIPEGRVEIFSDDGDEGRFYHGWVQADEDGHFTFTVADGVFSGRFVTATVTDAVGNTSSFSRPLVYRSETE